MTEGEVAAKLDLILDVLRAAKLHQGGCARTVWFRQHPQGYYVQGNGVIPGLPDCDCWLASE
jgi:hypothetical protein